jgi:DNA ligase-1
MSDIYKVKEIIDQIASTSSRTEKEFILKNYKDNELLKEILQFIYNPYILTGISKKKISKKLILPTHPNDLSIEEIMDYLKTFNSGRDNDIVYVQHFIKDQPEELRDFYTRIITKDMSIGISADTINKAFGEGFIPTFNVMLAKKYFEHQDKVTGNFVLTQKLDGNRIVVIKENGHVKSFTRQGNQYEGLEEIESDIQNLCYDNMVFDGELIADVDGSTHDVYTETTSKARSKGSNKTGLLFYIFDVLTLEDFQKGVSKDNCIDRKNMLSFIFTSNNLPHCREVKPLYIGNDKSQINIWLQYALDNGWEGIMLNLDKPYVCKRTDYILKVKVMNTCDLRVVGFEEGTGRNEDRLGALLVDYKGFTVGVGSGFTDQDREVIWQNREKFMNSIVEIQYFEESKNADGGLSLRFPVFKQFRHDKDEVSYN